MKIIVTGGTGFIGSHVVDAYLARGHRVAVVDSFAHSSRKNLNSHAVFYRADVRQAKVVERIMRRERPEVVSHHAALTSVPQSIAHPVPTLEANVLGTAHVVLAFAAHGTGRRKIILASSGGAIYGDARTLPTPETAPARPLSTYGLSKFLAEEILRHYAAERAVDYLILRYPNVYGPHQDNSPSGGAVARFIRLLKENKPVTIYGDGTKSRDYLFVGDVVRANLAALTRGHRETLNLGWGGGTTDREMFETIAKALKSAARPRYAPFRAGEVRKSVLDARRARRVLRWQPKTPFGEGVRRTVRSTA